MDEFIPSQPIGTDRVCLGVETESYYTTNLVVDTMETQWLLEPEEAGSITAMHDSVLINWNIEFNDTAWLQVKSINIYGESSYSVAKEIIVYPALNLLGISGPVSICTVNNEQTTFITLNPNAYKLDWIIEPETAGTIITQQDTAIITWSTSYEGEVKLKTATTNNCGNMEYSPIKTVQLKTCLGIGEQTYQSLKVYPNPAKDYIIFELPQNIKKSELYITDIYGTIITKINIPIQQSQLQWNCENISSGVYFYQAEIGGVFYRGKVVIE